MVNYTYQIDFSTQSLIILATTKCFFPYLGLAMYAKVKRIIHIFELSFHQNVSPKISIC